MPNQSVPFRKKIPGTYAKCSVDINWDNNTCVFTSQLFRKKIIVMKKLLIIVVTIAVWANCYAQSNYSFTNCQTFAGTYNDISATGTAIAMTDPQSGNSTAPQNIGFSFSFNGNTYTQFMIHADGAMQLGTVAPGAATVISANSGPYNPVFTNTTAAFQNCIFPLFADLVQAAAAPIFHVLTTGTAPNRVCTVQWKNLRDADSTGSTLQHQFEYIEFQVKLYETTNDIEVVFGNWVTSANLSQGRAFVNGIKASSSSFIAHQHFSQQRDFLFTEFFDPAGATSIGSIGVNYALRNSLPPATGHTMRYYGRIADDINVAELYADDYISQTGPLARNIQALIKNEGLNAATNIPVTLTVTGANGHTEIVNIASLAAGASQVVSFANFNVPVKGLQQVVVNINPATDGRAVNNNRQSAQVVTAGRTQLINESKSNFSGVGFTTATKFAAKMYGSGTKKISQVKIKFISSIQPVDVRIYEDNGTGNSPGATALFTSANFRTNADNELVVPIKPAITVDGDYYIAVTQQGTVNMGVEAFYQYPRLPQRNYSSALNATTWTEVIAASAATTFTTVYEETPNTDVGVEALVFSCNTTNSANDTVAFSIRNFSSLVHDYATNPVTLSGFAKDTVNNIQQPFSIVLNSGSIPAGGNDTIRVLTGYNTQTKGYYIFKAVTSCAADQEPGNDSLHHLFFNKINITASANPVCFNTNVTLTASNAYLTNHLWYRDAALTELIGGFNILNRVVGNPADTLSYVTALDYRGCRLRDSVIVRLQTNLPPKPVISSADTVLGIQNNFRVTLNVPPPPAGSSIAWLVNYGIPQNGGTEYVLQGFLNGVDIPLYPNYVRYSSSGCQGIADTANVRYAPGVLFTDNLPFTVNNDTAFYFAGPSTSYNGNTALTKTFSPGVAGKKVKLTIYHLNLGASTVLDVHDGPATTSPRQANLRVTNNGNVVQTFTSSDSTGVLTLRVIGNNTTGRGWLAKLSLEDVLQYRTVANGNFDSVSVWESKPISSGTYMPASRIPSRGDDSIRIQHNISISRQVPLDQTIITQSGSLQVLPSAYLNLYKTLPGIELVVDGALVVDNNGLVSNSSTTALGRIIVNGSLVNNALISVDTVIMAGNAAASVLSGTGSVERLKINNNEGVQVNGNQLIRTNLNLVNGVVNISPANYMQVREVATVINASPSSFVAGRLRRELSSSGTLVFPLGKGNRYRPASLQTTQTGFVVYEGEMFNTAPPLRALPAGITTINNQWYHNFTITEGAVRFTNATVTLNYFAGDGADDFSVLRIAKGDGANPWVNIGGVGTANGTGSITSGPFTSFSDFAIGNLAQGALPVRLISFTAQKQNSKVLLQWTTTNEINNSHFEVQRSGDGITYSTIGRVHALATPTDIKQYSFTDAQPQKGNNYYRLKQVDSDGRFEYSPIRKLIFDDKAQLLTVYPNPVSDELVIDFNTGSGITEVLVYDATGKLLQQRGFSSGLPMRVPVRNLVSGLYYLRVINGSVTEQTVFVKQ
jgi:hypothetical protein